MTIDEAKRVWREQSPVRFNGVTYTVRSLIYRYPSTLYLELLDKNGNCIVEALPDKVEVLHGEQDETQADARTGD